MAIIPGTLQTIQPKTATSTADDKGKMSTDVSVWFVFQDDNPNTLPVDVYNYSGMPRPGEIYYVKGRVLPQLICKSAVASRITNSPDYVNDRPDSCWWKVEFKYKRAGTPEDPPEYDTSNLSVASSTIVEPVVATHDYFGNPILNSAGQILDPPPQYSRRIPIFTFTRDEYYNPMFKKVQYEGAVNSVTFWGLPAYTVMVNEIRPNKTITFSVDPEKQSNPAWNVTYEIAVNLYTHGYDADGQEIYGWQTAMLDCGRSEWLDENSVPPWTGPAGFYRVTNEDGLEVDDPIRLNGRGRRLSHGEPDVFLRRMLHPLADLNALELPNPFSV